MLTWIHNFGVYFISCLINDRLKTDCLILITYSDRRQLQPFFPSIELTYRDVICSACCFVQAKKLKEISKNVNVDEFSHKHFPHVCVKWVHYQHGPCRDLSNVWEKCDTRGMTSSWSGIYSKFFRGVARLGKNNSDTLNFYNILVMLGVSTVICIQSKQKGELTNPWPGSVPLTIMPEIVRGLSDKKDS